VRVTKHRSVDDDPVAVQDWLHGFPLRLYGGP